MGHINYKTKFTNKHSVDKRWVIVDAASQKLGRLASRVAYMIRGKHKPNFTPHVDCGDKVIIINAAKISLTGKKWTNKRYISHSGYPGSQRVTTPQELNNPVGIIERAVKGMLPKNKLGRRLFHNMVVCKEATHPHAAQKPQEIMLN